MHSKRKGWGGEGGVGCGCREGRVDGEEVENRRGRLSRHGASWSRGGGRREVGKMHTFMHFPDHSFPWTDISVCSHIHVVKIN